MRHEGDNRRMPIRVVRLGSRRRRGEGLRLGTVRRPPRGVPKTEFARQDWYDVWLPALAPSASLLRTATSAGGVGGWKRFEKRYRAEMNRGDAARLLDLLAALSHSASFAVGCYCEDERSCHRSILRRLL